MLQYNPWIVTVVGGIVVLVLFAPLVFFWNRIVTFLGWKPQKSTQTVPPETLKIVSSTNGNHWSSGTFAGKPCIFVSAQMAVTNILNHPVQIVKARLEEFGSESYVGIVRGNIGGKSIPLVQWKPEEAFALFRVMPPPVKVGQDLVATLILIDNLNNEHKVDGYHFISIEGLVQAAEVTANVARQQTIEEIRSEVSVDLRSNKPLVVTNQNGVKCIYVWPVIYNFSLTELKITNFDVRIQVGQFITEKSGSALGEKIRAQYPKGVMVRIPLNDAEVRALEPYITDNVLREAATINVFGNLESPIGDVPLNQVFQRSNEYVGL